jgi:hypothetical protein
MLYLDTESRRQLSLERIARLAADYRQAQPSPPRRRRLRLPRPHLRIRIVVGPGISLGPRP